MEADPLTALLLLLCDAMLVLFAVWTFFGSLVASAPPSRELSRPSVTVLLR